MDILTIGTFIIIKCRIFNQLHNILLSRIIIIESNTSVFVYVSIFHDYFYSSIL